MQPLSCGPGCRQRSEGPGRCGLFRGLLPVNTQGAYMSLLISPVLHIAAALPALAEGWACLTGRSAHTWCGRLQESMQCFCSRLMALIIARSRFCVHPEPDSSPAAAP